MECYNFLFGLGIDAFLIFYPLLFKLMLRKGVRNMGRILIVDDEPHIRFLIRKVLEAADHNVTEAKNGIDGIIAFTASPETFDVIVLDIMMPIMNGFEFLNRLQPVRFGVPVLVLSASHNHCAEAEAHGATTALIKPFNRALLTDMVGHLATHPTIPFQRYQTNIM
jgi:two-component system, chemotaxis family, chemotaxis protein CheY